MTSLFLHNVTHVDCAVLGNNGLPSGLSFVPAFRVHGNVSGDEQVIEDFSSIKKRIKQLIDDPDYGYDHKLIIPMVSDKAKDDPFYLQHSDHLQHSGSKGVKLDVGHIRINCPSNAIRVIHDFSTQTTVEPVLTLIQRSMEDYLSTRLGMKVEVFIPEPQVVQPNGLHYFCPERHAIAYQFEYTHGLPKSTSWGCQNILHGHSSFIQLASDRFGDTEESQAFVDSSLTALAESIAAYLDEAYIVCKDYYQNSNGLQVISYESRDRGYFELHLPSDYNVVVMDNEPTIENITQHIAKQFEAELKENRVTSLAISEGLWKGCLINLPYGD